MKSKTLSLFIVVAIVLLPLIYLAVIWNQVPQQVPLHFNAHFQPDRTGNKSALWIPAGILAGISFLLYLLLRNIQLLDPKRRGKPVSNVYTKLAFVLVLFMTALNFVIIISAVKGGNVMQHLIFPLLGLMFVFIGNYMHNIKPNYFAGYRLPWTLSDDSNWKRTHLLASKLWFWGGLLFTIISFFLPAAIVVTVLIAIVAIMVLIPVVYSYRMFRNGVS